MIGKVSHARAMLPLARACAEAGHEVLVVTLPELAHVFAGESLPVRGVLPSYGTASRTGPVLSDAYRVLEPIAREFKPDLFLRDGTEFAATMVGDTLGIPHISVPSGSGNVFDPAIILDPMNERRTEVGIPTRDDPYAVFRHGRLDCMPPEYSFITNPTPGTFAYQQPAAVSRHGSLPPWLADLPTDRPLVLAAIGTALPLFKDKRMNVPEERWRKHNPQAVLDAMVTGLAELDCVAVVATGGVPVRDESRSDHVHLVDFVDQPLLLRCAQLLLTHGGYNSVREAVTAGVPMAVLPVFGDQPRNADRVEELSLGARVPDVSAEDVAKTCERVLRDEAVARQTRRAQRRMLTLPDVTEAVAELERVAADRRPLTGS
ncbi:glycosyltransferase [Streptomyces naphthomycinicus]|uniref:glycosyltransferase n=1 Tax=Streptomyces naphthomycinicus TaxID=2872625 RepID=UPI001CEDD45E|nr:glycosyltransferase [Streptomyces sp. TML10]